MSIVRGMARILIVHATRSGATTDVATILSEGLRGRGHDVDVRDAGELPSPGGYDLAVVGSGIHTGAWYSEALAWLDRHGASGVPVALFNVCLNAAKPEKRDETLGYNAVATGKATPVAQESFAGRYVPERVGFFKRLLLRTMQQPAQDHVDPERIRAWADELDAALVAR